MKYVLFVVTDLFEAEIPCESYEEYERKLRHHLAVAKKHDWPISYWVREVR